MKKISVLVLIASFMSLFLISCDYSLGKNDKNNAPVVKTDDHQDDPDHTDDLNDDQGETDNNDGSGSTVSSLPDIEDLQTEVPLHTRRDRNLGSVLVWNDNNYLYVKYSSPTPLVITDLAVESSLELIPQTKRGNPKIRRFEFKTWHKKGVKEYTYKIDIQDKNFEFGTELYIAAHALVIVSSDSEKGERHTRCSHYEIKSAWAEGFDFPGKSWATYFTHRLYQPKFRIYYNGSSVAFFDIPVIINNRSIIEYYSYGTPYGASYNGNIILGESEVIQAFIVKDTYDQIYFVVVFDTAPDDTGGTADVSITSEGLAGQGLSFVVRDDPGEGSWNWDDSLGGADLSFSWLPCCTDGFALGPLPTETGYTLDLQFSSLTGINSLKTHFTDNSGDLASREIPSDQLNRLRFEYK